MKCFPSGHLVIAKIDTWLMMHSVDHSKSMFSVAKMLRISAAIKNFMG
jgi:hypothetical protein